MQIYPADHRQRYVNINEIRLVVESSLVKVSQVLKNTTAAVLDLRTCSVAAKRAGSLLLTLFQQVILIHKLFVFSKNQFDKKEHAGNKVFYC